MACARTAPANRRNALQDSEFSTLMADSFVTFARCSCPVNVIELCLDDAVDSHPAYMRATLCLDGGNALERYPACEAAWGNTIAKLHIHLRIYLAPQSAMLAMEPR